MEVLRELTRGMERMLARVPTGSDPRRGWQDEGRRIFAPARTRRAKMEISNISKRITCEGAALVAMHLARGVNAALLSRAAGPAQ
jgi:hypothetical protein